MEHNLRAKWSNNFATIRALSISFQPQDTPKSNGQADITNKTILNCNKKGLDRAKGGWVKKLPGILWAYRTRRRRIEKTPFALALKTEAKIPTEATLPALCSQLAATKFNEEQLHINLDLLEAWRKKRTSPNQTSCILITDGSILQQKDPWSGLLRRRLILKQDTA